MMHKAWSSIEEVPYCFWRSSVKFQGHTGWKIDDWNPIWVRLLGRSQLSNPSDLPCSRSYVKFQGHKALKIVEFDPNWAFPDSNSSLNSPMAMKCCTKLETAKERCPIVFQGHPSNFKVTRDKTSPILTQIGRFRTIGRSQLSNPSDLPCLPEASIGLRVLSLPASVRPSVTKFVRAITHHPFKLGSPNLDHRCKRPWLRSLLFLGVIDLDLQGQI